MEDKEIIQLMHEGYHSLEVIADAAGLPTDRVVAIYNEFLNSLTPDELEARGY